VWFEISLFKPLKQRQDKLEKMEERKANAKKGKTLD